MPSWNIHTAHVEHLLAHNDADVLGIPDRNAFLFGNYVPDIYLGFMVPGITYHIDYCVTHLAVPDVIPVPCADQFWDLYVARLLPDDDAGKSIALGAWAHLVADRCYNARFRVFRATRETPTGEALRTMKQDDFARFGRSFSLSSTVKQTDELVRAAESFKQYSVLPGDTARAIRAANDIVRSNSSKDSDCNYQLLDEAWMRDTFALCDERLAVWLKAYKRLDDRGESIKAEAVRKEAGLQIHDVFS